jgi:hypothetical protein
MKRLLHSACVLLAMQSLAWQAQAQDRARYEKMIAKHAKANLVPEALVHRLIVRESKYHPELIGHGGTIGLMQIKLATARGVGYAGDADGLRDPETNLAYGVKYLAGAYRAAAGDYDRAIRYFAGGYYYVAKQQRIERLKQGKADLNAAPPKIAKVEEKPAVPTEDVATSDDTASAETAKIGDAAAKPAEAPVKLVPATAKPAHTATKPKPAAKKKKLADAKTQVPRPPATVPSGANGAKPR